MNILAIGYGDIAQRVARRLIGDGHQVTGLCRHPEDKPPIDGVELVAGDASNEEDLRGVLQTDYDAIVITLTPTQYDGEGYRQGYVVPCRHLQQVLNSSGQSPYVMYLSSTGVYGQQQGEWIDEQSPTEPNSDSGKMLLQAETLIRDLPLTSTILRCSGIYGQGRDFMVRQLQNHKVTLRDSWTNRIHQDDVAGFIQYLINHPEHRQSHYLVSDDQPTPQYEVYQWLAHKLGVEVSSTIEPGPGPRGSKRCNNARLRQTGYLLNYANFKQGYCASFDDVIC